MDFCFCTVSLRMPCRRISLLLLRIRYIFFSACLTLFYFIILCCNSNNDRKQLGFLKSAQFEYIFLECYFPRAEKKWNSSDWKFTTDIMPIQESIINNVKQTECYRIRWLHVSRSKGLHRPVYKVVLKWQKSSTATNGTPRIYCLITSCSIKMIFSNTRISYLL